ncbi:hypothetical protein Tco_1028335 [Tanacetum coccineum]|uniref:Uncharacterized protein n=1 Tax=Tanacetum coccineum TaxID=301880 RepID=A0ABQ5G1W0_9ASTR
MNVVAGIIVPESYEDQMMLAMAVSLSEACARRTSVLKFASVLKLQFYPPVPMLQFLVPVQEARAEHVGKSVVIPSNNGASGSGNNNTINETMNQAVGEIVDENLVSIQQALAELSSQVLGISLQNQQMGNVTDAEKVKFILIHLYDKALLWHSQYIKNHGGFVSWKVYKEAVLARFGSMFNHPMAKLKILCWVQFLSPSVFHFSLCNGTETEEGPWLELQFSLVDNSKLNVVYLLNRN